MNEGRSTETVRIDALVCGPGFQELLAEPRVIAIAERVAIDGVTSTLPIVRADDMNVIAGEDVIAAYCLLDIEEVPVELVHDGSLDNEPLTEVSPHADAQCAHTVAWEGLPARSAGTNADPLLHEDVASVVRAAVAAGASLQRSTLEHVQAVQAHVGTQKAAVAAVAAETGRSEHAVKKAANRAKRAQDKVSIETWGRPQPAAWMDATVELRRAMTTASNSIRTAMSALSPLVAGMPVPGVSVTSTYERLKEHAAALRACRPAGVCPWCKNDPGLVLRCTPCSGRGWLGEQRMSLVPRELLPAAGSCGHATFAPAGDVALAPERLPGEPPTKEQAEDAWKALEEANGGEPFLDDAALEDDGGVW